MDAVFFDMDGVVVDSERYWVPAERDRIFPATVEESVDPHDVTGLNVQDLYDHLDEEYTVLVDREAFVARYDETATEVYTERAALMEGFDEAVAAAREHDAAVGLVSSSPRRWIRLVLDRFDLADTFDAVASAEDVERGKPDPAVYLRAADDLDVDPTRSVAVEDSANGARAARAAGMAVVGFGAYEHAPESADATASDGGDLRRLFANGVGVEDGGVEEGLSR
ncbi:HAD family hydrolase [Halomarina ordinaria]|uniref:HAD family hydrolase n=1 Tax=Halomarina ordinaria TaxID=3033939 RepID=A0ABD5U7Y3_9EURY|nr:HAD-IA family hydrolase [Halomarina sp. PSRA2]